MQPPGHVEGIGDVPAAVQEGYDGEFVLEQLVKVHSLPVHDGDDAIHGAHPVGHIPRFPRPGAQSGHDLVMSAHDEAGAGLHAQALGDRLADLAHHAAAGHGLGQDGRVDAGEGHRLIDPFLFKDVEHGAAGGQGVIALALSAQHIGDEVGDEADARRFLHDLRTVLVHPTQFVQGEHGVHELAALLKDFLFAAQGQIFLALLTAPLVHVDHGVAQHLIVRIQAHEGFAEGGHADGLYRLPRLGGGFPNHRHGAVQQHLGVQLVFALVLAHQVVFPVGVGDHPRRVVKHRALYP